MSPLRTSRSPSPHGVVTTASRCVTPCMCVCVHVCVCVCVAGLLHPDFGQRMDYSTALATATELLWSEPAPRDAPGGRQSQANIESEIMRWAHRRRSNAPPAVRCAGPQSNLTGLSAQLVWSVHNRRSRRESRSQQELKQSQLIEMVAPMIALSASAAEQVTYALRSSTSRCILLPLLTHWFAMRAGAAPGQWRLGGCIRCRQRGGDSGGRAAATEPQRGGDIGCHVPLHGGQVMAIGP
jgi:hypothetical protein